jgi:hypothetical protein
LEGSGGAVEGSGGVVEGSGGVDEGSGGAVEGLGGVVAGLTGAAGTRSNVVTPWVTESIRSKRFGFPGLIVVV